MKDKEFLQWIYNRMVNIHNENPDVDYMIKFKSLLTGYKQSNQLELFDEYYKEASDEQIAEDIKIAESLGTENGITLEEYEEMLGNKFSYELESNQNNVNRGCPCLYLDEPCHPRCTCVNSMSSSGCRYCATYGSIEQRKEKAKSIADKLQSPPPEEGSLPELCEEHKPIKGVLEYTCKKCWRRIDKDGNITTYKHSYLTKRK